MGAPKIMLLGEASQQVGLTEKDVVLFRDILSNGNKFKAWTAKNNPDLVFLAKALYWELQRDRTRTDVVRHIVEKYNRILGDANRNSVYALLGEAA